MNRNAFRDDSHVGFSPASSMGARYERMGEGAFWDEPEVEPNYFAPHPSGLPRRAGEPWDITAGVFDGVVIDGLTTGLVASFPNTGSLIPEAGGWHQSEEWVWFVHAAFTDHLVLLDTRRNVWLVIQRFRRSPDVRQLRDAAATLFGSQKPTTVIGMPARFRLPLAGPRRGDFGRHRGAPVPHTDITRFQIADVHCTSRLIWTTIPGRATYLWTEVIIGSTQNQYGEERAMLYVADAARVAAAMDTNADHFVALVIDRLIAHAIEVCEELDLLPDPRATSRHLHIATLRSAGQHVVGDVQLPGVTGSHRFAMLPVDPFVQPVRSDSEMVVLLRRIARGAL